MEVQRRKKKKMRLKETLGNAKDNLWGMQTFAQGIM